MAFALALALLCLVQAAGAALFVDQSQAASVTTFKIPAGGLWQSFTPSWTGNLTAINVLLGASAPTAPCVPYSGVLQIYVGAGAKSTTNHFAGRTALLTQNVVSSSCQCNTQDCVSWQQWQLDSPVSVVADQEYSFYLSRDTNAAVMRVAMMNVDSYPRGENLFQAPGYDFAFKTMMATDGNSLASDGSSDSSAVSSTSSPLLVYGVGIVAAAIAVLAVVLLLIYRRRERMRTEWMSAEQALAELRGRFGVEATAVPDTEQPVDVDSVAVTLAEAPLQNNWVLEERPTTRSRTSSLAFRHGPMALPPGPVGSVNIEEDDVDNETVTETDLSFLPAPSPTFHELPERTEPLADNWTLEARPALSPRALSPARARVGTLCRSPMALPGAPAVSVEDDLFDDVIGDVLAETDFSSPVPAFQELPERPGPLSNNWILEERPAPAPAPAATARPRTGSRTLHRGPMALPAGVTVTVPDHIELDFDDGATVTETDLKFLPPLGEDVSADE